MAPKDDSKDDSRDLDQDQLVPPLMVLICETGRAYRVRYRNVAQTLQEINDAGQIEVYGPFGRPGDGRYAWVGSDDPPTGDSLVTST